MRSDQEFWDWLWEEDDGPPPPSPPDRATATGTVEGDQDRGSGSPDRQRPSRVQRSQRRRSTRRARLIAAVGTLAAVAVVATVVVVVSRTTDRPPGEPSGSVPVFGEQLVVAWAVLDEGADGRSFVSVLGAGGGRPAVAVAVPGNTVVSIPGRSEGTVDEATDGGDVSVVAATVENILGVRVDEAWGIDMGTLRRLVDAFGGIRAGFEELDGAGAVAYLRMAPAIERAIRWQEVLDGLLAAVGEQPDLLEGLPEDTAPPEPVRPAFAAGERDVVILPVQAVEAGLADVDIAAVEALVAARFVPTGSADKVRLVVLNGNGTPGIGTEVARLLVPEGFTLVASTNADTFDQEVTAVVASATEFLDEAQRAQQLLGVGEVRLGRPSGLADVLVVVGKDFRPDDPGGP